jgi:hypothetical protein
MTQAADRCSWCGAAFVPRRGGSPQSFCTAAHRAYYHRAARRWCEREIAAGRLTVAAIRDGPAAAYTLPGRQERLSGVPDQEPPDPAFLGALRGSRRVVLRVPIDPEGIAELLRLGWLDRRQINSPVAVADAVVSLADAALAASLRAR